MSVPTLLERAAVDLIWQRSTGCRDRSPARSTGSARKRRIKTFPRNNTWLDDGGAVYRSILSTTCRGFSVPASGCKFALLELCSSDSVTQRPGVCAPCRRSFATGTAVPYDARPPIVGFDTEVSHATQERTPRRRLVSRSPVNEGRVSPPRRGSNVERASLAATKSSERSSAEMIHAHVSRAGDFKNCCMLTGEFDGSDRDHFFQRVMGCLASVVACLVPRGR